MRLLPKPVVAICLFLSLSASAGAGKAAVVIDWVEIGDAGNVGEIVGAGVGGSGTDRVCGAVDHSYCIGKYEVTNGQYIEFLRAVAAGSDPHGLFELEDPGGHGGMDGAYGGIQRLGTAGAYTYRAKYGNTLWLNKPVHFISFYDALRFANWIHNGQPSGPQDASTTEDGAYDLTLGTAVVRKPGARVFLPSEDEWYKAAYYKGGSADAGYWDYPTRSDEAPVGELPPGRATPPGSANYEVNGMLAVGLPYYAVDVGAYTHSASPYGTHNQAGNVHEWVEDPAAGGRGLHGGGWPSSDPGFARHRIFGYPPEGTEYLHTGFRLAGSIDNVGLEPPRESPAHSAAWLENRVEIRWLREQGAIGTEAFAIDRREQGRGARTHIADPAIDVLPGQYLFCDRTAEAATTYVYEVLAIGDGDPEPLFAVTITTPRLDFSLHSSRPNPFNPRTTIAYSLAKATRVSLGLYDLQGRLVRRLVDGVVPSGRHTVEWDGKNDRGLTLPSATYVIRLETARGIRTGKVTLMK